MKTVLVLAVVAISAGCGGGLRAGQVQTVRACGDDDVRCVDTAVGTFQTREPNVTALQQVLAGDPGAVPHLARVPRAKPEDASGLQLPETSTSDRPGLDF